MKEENIEYDLFLSYSTDPDYGLSRKVEGFLESFHEQIKTKGDFKLKELQVCRDGSDFKLNEIFKEARKTKVEVKEFTKKALAQYLGKSKNLLVLCSKNSRTSEYMDFEIKWFLENKPQGSIFLAITEGKEINSESIEFFNPQIIKHNIPYHLAYDFRGYNKKESTNWKKVKKFDDELINLAAELNDTTGGEISPIWHREQEDKLREEKDKLLRQRTTLFIVASIALVTAMVAFWQKDRADKAKEEAQNNLKNYEVAEFNRSIRNGEIYVNANEFDLAREQLQTADSIRKNPLYEEVSDIINKKERLENLLKECETAQ